MIDILKYVVACTLYLSYKIDSSDGSIHNDINFPIPYKPLPDNKNETNWTSHFQYPHIVQIYCNKTFWDKICKSNSTTPKKLCAGRMDNSSGSEHMDWKEFNNNCYLFLSNMCDYPGQEYYIYLVSDCKSHLARQEISAKMNSGTTIFDSGTTITGTISTIFDNATTNSPPRPTFNASQHFDLRRADLTTPKTTTKLTLKKKWQKLYKSKTDFQHKLCPLSCPNQYKPVCLAINRQRGLYYRQLTFVNECFGRRYSCIHPEDFTPPPGADSEEEVAPTSVSDISWSFCAAARYTQFARFSETASSLAHYGWLHGSYDVRHILTPQERDPAYG